VADDRFDRLLDFAAILVRRTPLAARTWHAVVARSFRRDVTCFDWRVDSLLDDLGVAHRSYPSKHRIPGRVAVARDARDAPAADVIGEFLGRGGTLVVEGTELLDRLELGYTREPLERGRVAVSGALVDELRLFSEFWADHDSSTIAIAGATVLVECSAGPLVSSLAHLGGTLVSFATGASAFSRDSSSKITVTARALGAELGIALEPIDALADDQVFPRDLFAAEITMAGALGHTIAGALA